MKILTVWTIFWQRSFSFVFAETLYPSEILMQKNPHVTSGGTFFFFCADEVFRDSKYSIKQKVLRGPCELARERKQQGSLARWYFPGVFLSTAHHAILPGHPMKFRDYTHTRMQVPLHCVGRLRNLLEFARTALTQINTCDWCSASLGLQTA